MNGKDYKNPFTFYFLIIILISVSFALINSNTCAYESVQKDEWIYQDSTIGVYYNHDNDDIDYDLKTGLEGGHTITISVEEDSEKWAYVKMKIDVNEFSELELDYYELLFKIRKENNDAILISEGHPYQGERLGFFPFYVFSHEDMYEKTYHYILGGETEPVCFVNNYNSIYFDRENMSQMQVRFGSVYVLQSVRENKLYEHKLLMNQTFEIGYHLDVTMKQHEGDVYIIHSEARFPAEFFFREDNLEGRALVEVWASYSWDQRETIEFLNSIQMEEPGNDNSTVVSVALLGILIALSAGAGYVAYKKKGG